MVKSHLALREVAFFKMNCRLWVLRCLSERKFRKWRK